MCFIVPSHIALVFFLFSFKSETVLNLSITWRCDLRKCVLSMLIKRVRPFVPPAALLYIYSALIQPHFDYCNLVWGNCGKTLSDRLQKLQNRAARVLTSSSYDTDAKELAPYTTTRLERFVYPTSNSESLNGI